MEAIAVVAPASGSRQWLRGAALGCLLAASLTACGGGQGLQPKASLVNTRLLVPMQTIMGGRLATALDETGTPKLGSLRGHVNFIIPAAIAVRGPDLYVADLGTSKLYRLDTMQQTLSVVAGVAATPRMQLQVASDLSLYILDPDHAAILHITRGGRLLQKFTDRALAMNLTHFVLDEGMGRIIASDQLNQRLLRLPTAGRIVSVLPEAGVGEFRSIGALAASGDAIFALDTSCACIVRLDVEGRVQERIGHGVLKQPQAMVVDREQRLFVADSFDRTLKVFQNGQQIARFEPHQLGVMNIGALAFADGKLYVADGPGARVAVFRVQPAVKGNSEQGR